MTVLSAYLPTGTLGKVTVSHPVVSTVQWGAWDNKALHPVLEEVIYLKIVRV